MNEAANLLSISLLHKVRFLGIVVFPLINSCFTPQPIDYLQRVNFLRGYFLLYWLHIAKLVTPCSTLKA
jgi:hypothetical protein